MKAQWKRGHKNDGLKAKGRRKRALERLTAGLKAYKSSMTKEDDANKQHPWYSKIRKAEKEIEILKTRI